MCLRVPGSLGSGNKVFIGIDLLYLGSLPLLRNVSLVPRSLNLHILHFFYVDSHLVRSELRPLSVGSVWLLKHTSLLRACGSARCSFALTCAGSCTEMGKCIKQPPTYSQTSAGMKDRCMQK